MERFAWLLFVVVLGAGTQRDNAVAALPAIPTFPLTSRSAAVEVFADLDLPVEDLRVFAEDALQDLREWLGAVPRRGRDVPRYSIYLCAQLETIRKLEEAYSLPRSDDGPQRTFAFRGGFYPEAGLIALRCAAGEDVRWQLAHELAHAVFDEIVGRPCDPIDEGLAEHAAMRVLRSDTPSYPLDAAAQAARRRTLPRLERFFQLDYWEFRDRRRDRLHFALAWAFAGLLLEDPQFRALLLAMREQDPWIALASTYDVAALEARWHGRIKALTRWSPVFGDWTQAGEALQATTNERGGTAILVHSDPPALGQPYSIRARLDSDPGEEIGFVVGHWGTQDYTVVALRPAERRMVVAKRDRHRWSALGLSDVEALPVDWTIDDLTLRCDASGEITIAYGEQDLACYALGLEAFGGAVGLFTQPSLELDRVGDRCARPVTYRCAEVRLHRGGGR